MGRSKLLRWLQLGQQALGVVLYIVIKGLLPRHPPSWEDSGLARLSHMDCTERAALGRTERHESGGSSIL